MSWIANGSDSDRPKRSATEIACSTPFSGCSKTANSSPPIRANRPSVDVSALTYEVKKGRFKTTEALENLKSSISSLVVLRAKDNIPLVRETARHQTTEFIEKWLARSFADGKQHPVKVYFPGEKPSDVIELVPSSSR